MVQSCQDLLSLEEGEGRLYGEVQRARRFQRTLTLASLSFSGGFKAEQVDLLTRQARVEIARRFLESRVATSLLRLVGPGDLIVQDDGEFVLLFPEVAADAVRPRLESVARELREELGITLRWGAAEFPDQECTLTGLMELAAADANGSDECRQPASGNQVAAGQLAGETGLAD